MDRRKKIIAAAEKALIELEKVIRKWTPAIFIGCSNTTFDDSMVQNSFFRGLRYPYQMTSSPNKKHDGLKIAQGAYTVDNSIYKTEDLWELFFDNEK